MRFDGPQLCSFSSNAHDNLSYRQCRVPEEVVRRLVDRMGHQEHVDRGGRLGGQRRFLPLPGPPSPFLPSPFLLAPPVYSPTPRFLGSPTQKPVGEPAVVYVALGLELGLPYSDGDRTSCFFSFSPFFLFHLWSTRNSAGWGRGYRFFVAGRQSQLRNLTA